MLTLSAAAQTALDSAVQKSTPKLVIKPKNETALTVNATDMLSGSLSISNQCSEGNELTLGSAYIGELDVTLMPSVANHIGRQAMQGATVTAYVTYADMTIQLGVFYVDEAEWSKSGVTLTCYDGMSKLTKAYTGGELEGKAYDLLKFACQTCGVTFGMTKAQVNAFPNATESIKVYGDADLSEWRDFVGWVAQTLCAFATIDNQGKLVIRKYGYSSVKTLDASKRSNSSKFSSFATRYTGISYVNVDDQVTKYIGLTVDDALTMNLGQNPFLQYGLQTKKTRIATAILNELANGAWVPFECELPYIPPVYELGDCITFTGRFAGTSSVSCVMGYEWNTHDGLTLKGYGSDPALATSKSKLDKQMSGLLSKVSKDTVQYYPFVNTVAYTVGSNVAILAIDYASNQDGVVEFHANVDLNATGTVSTGTNYKIYNRTQLTVTYELNGEVLETQPLDSYTDGWHILHLFRPLAVNEGEFNQLRILLTASNGTINIGIGGVRAMVSGRCLAANDSEWRGTQNLFDTVEFSLLGSLAVGYSASVTPTLNTYDQQSMAITTSYSLLSSLEADFTAAVTTE